MYNVVNDLNHAMIIDTHFMMNEIIDSERGVYREESILTNPETGMVPNWLIMFKMQDCYFCDVIEPTID